MLAGNPNGGIGEWGFAAIVEVDGQRILFDTGARPDTVLKNDDEKLDWTASELKEFGLRNFLGAHCTGVEAVYRIRRQVGLNRQNCVVGAVGSSFDLDKEIDPLLLAR